MSQESSFKKKRNGILRRLLLVVLGILLGVSVYFVNARSLMRNQLPMPFGRGGAVVLSGSMEPTLSVGDLIIVKRADSYKVGDIVVYQSMNDLIVHRIVSIDNETYITKGDANNTEDPAITKDVIQGVVIKSIPYIGNFLNVLHTPVGIAIVLILSILLIESSFDKDKKKGTEEIETIKEEIRLLKERQSKEKEEN